MSRFSKGMRITKKTIRYFFIFLIVAANVAIFWRVFSSSDPKAVKTISVNDALLAEYNKNGKDLYMFTQDQRQLTYADYNYGYFGVTQAIFIPDANQVQIVFRYNNSTLASVAEDYNLPSAPPRNSEVFDVTLLLSVDLTPDNAEDNTGEEWDGVEYIRIGATESVSFKKNMYNYRRLVFDLKDINLEELIDSRLLLAVYTDIYYTEDTDYDERPYGTLCVYDYLSENNRVSLKSRDVKAIKKYEESN